MGAAVLAGMGFGIAGITVTVTIAGIFIPLTSPLLLSGVAVASFVPLLWGGGRCAWALYDRGVHGQPVTDLESVPLWLGTATALLGRTFCAYLGVRANFLPKTGMGS